MGKMLGRAILCAIAGLIGWLITEPMLPKEFASPDWAAAEFRMVIIAMLFTGLAAGFHQGYMKGGRRNILLGLALGAVFGTIGGVLGYQIGGTLSNALFGSGWALRPFPIIPRTLTFAMIGMFLGAGVGVTQFRTRIIIAGAFGGLLGGGIAGLFFDPLGSTVGQIISAGGESGFAGRALMWPLMGFTVGLFTAWLEQATRQAWVRLIVGRNEGKEWPIDAAQTHLGRDERAHVPLFGDNNVAPLHAIITRQGPQYILHDAGSPIGTGYQGVRMSAPVALQPGDFFQIGPHQLQFLVKGSAARRIQEGRNHPLSVPMERGPGGEVLPGGTGVTSVQQNHQVQAPVGQPGVNPRTQLGGTGVTSQTNFPPQDWGGQGGVDQTVPAATTYTLIALDGPLTGQRFPITAPTEAGRESPGINLGFDPQTSRRHALISPTPNGLHIKDLGSTNGTFLNGQLIPEAAVPVGSTIKIGSTTFRIE